jgi:acyl-CoA reductase-like NAD-dependent aldehyde dehydrogenase
MVGVCLELGGKDPAYVRADADIAYSATEIADGAVFNSGQSCCAVERVYVASSVYDTFIEKLVDELKGYKLGDPNGPFSSFSKPQKPYPMFVGFRFH